jgi:deoxyribodipyrimidine photo-lyase
VNDRVRQYKSALHVFRRDLRLFDNSARRAALQQSDLVATCLVLDDRQVGDHPYRSVNSLAFALETLEDFSSAIAAHGGRLLICAGDPATVVPALGTEAVLLNRDYTPFSQARDEAIETACLDAGVASHAYDDALLVAPQALHKDNGEPYTVFTPLSARPRIDRADAVASSQMQD